VLARWLQQQGLPASTFETEYGDEETVMPAETHDEAGAPSDAAGALGEAVLR